MSHITLRQAITPPMDSEEAARRIQYAPVGTILHRALMGCVHYHDSKEAALEKERTIFLRRIRNLRWTILAAAVGGAAIGPLVACFAL